MALSGKKILIQEYSSIWAQQFELLTEVYLKYLAHLVIGVEHVGSTAVPGLCAKPVIDIDIVVDSMSQVERIIPILVKLGYEYLGEVAIPERFVFRPISTAVPSDGSGRLWPKHHLYCCISGSTALRNHIMLRDALLNDDSLVRTYATLKRELVERVNTMDEYVLGKTDFIASVLAGEGMSNSELSAIAQQNTGVIPPAKL